MGKRGRVTVKETLDQRLAAMQWMYDDAGMTLAEIGRAYGITRQGRVRAGGASVAGGGILLVRCRERPRLLGMARREMGTENAQIRRVSRPYGPALRRELCAPDCLHHVQWASARGNECSSQMR